MPPRFFGSTAVPFVASRCCRHPLMVIDGFAGNARAFVCVMVGRGSSGGWGVVVGRGVCAKRVMDAAAAKTPIATGSDRVGMVVTPKLMPAKDLPMRWPGK